MAHKKFCHGIPKQYVIPILWYTPQYLTYYHGTSGIIVVPTAVSQVSPWYTLWYSSITMVPQVLQQYTPRYLSNYHGTHCGTHILPWYLRYYHRTHRSTSGITIVHIPVSYYNGTYNYTSVVHTTVFQNYSTVLVLDAQAMQFFHVGTVCSFS